MRSKLIVCACLLGLGVAGCGTAGKERDAAAVAERFHAALAARDGQAACAELNPETASNLEQQEKKPCEEAIVTLALPRGASVEDTRVYETSAFAQLGEGGADFLDLSSDGWWVSAAGRQITAPEQPYDCELED